MSSRLIMTLAAVACAVPGLLGLFAPQEVASALTPSPDGFAAIPIQIAAGGLLGFALLDWFNRKAIIGGVYGRPLALANLLLFANVALTLLRGIADGLLPAAAAIGAVIFGGIAIGFGLLIFGPRKSG